MPDLPIDDLPVEQPVFSHDALDADGIVSLIVGIDDTWEAGAPLANLEVQWTPHLVRPDKNWVLHVHLSAGAPRYVERRLASAAEGGHLVHVALTLDALYDSDMLEVLSDTDAYVYVIDERGRPTPRRHHLAALADLGVPVEPDLRRRLATAAWERRGDGTGNQRGRRLEALLAFLLAQVADFRIFQRNFRTDTGEIDIVLQIDNYSGRCWYESGVPFILVESKNIQERAGQPVISLLIRRLQTSRRRARIGLAFSAGGFTSDAEREELRLSESELCVALFDGKTIEAMIASSDLEQFLDEHIGRAMLR
jgi:Holliday junction resolvase-like predicted endonuclease